MADGNSTVNVAALLLAQAQAKRAKRDSRMSGATLLAHVVAFVNSGAAFAPNMQDGWKGSPSTASVVSRYNGIIKTNGLDDQVYCIDGADNGVCLVNLTAAA